MVSWKNEIGIAEHLADASAITELRKNVPSDLVIHIVGSKVDLAPRSRRVE